MNAIRRGSLLVGLLLSGLAFEVSARQPDCLSGDTTIWASPTRKDHVGRILAPVMINGQGPFRFIIDTGASHSTVSPALVQALGLQSTTDVPMLVNGITGTAMVPSVSIDRLEAGSLELESTRLPVVWAPLMAGADGILGVAGLRKERILVEFVRNRVCVSRSNGVGTPMGFIKIPATRLTGGLLSIDARVGGVRTRAIVDTGAERSLGNIALRDALLHARPSQAKLQTTDVYGSTDEIVQGEMGGAFPMISLGPIKIGNTELVYGDFHIFEVWNLEERPALILGMDVLGSVRSLAIDFRNQELYVDGVYYNIPGATRTQ